MNIDLVMNIVYFLVNLNISEVLWGDLEIFCANPFTGSPK